MPGRTARNSATAKRKAIMASVAGMNHGQTCIVAPANGHNHHSQPVQQQIPQRTNNAPPSTKKEDRVIGYGAFGVVWCVTEPREGKQVALKKLPNVFQSLASSIRVFRELMMMRFFRHENVLSCLEILMPPELENFHELYLIMELMESDLHKIIVSPQTLTEDHIKVFLYQILRGLKYLHSAKIMHRDIKPGNILVNTNCQIKICDFGLARVQVDDPQKHLTQEVVTQYYRAPEILMGASYYTKSIDIWSVGCIFGELLGRRILFQAHSPLQQLELITDLLGTPSASDMRYACDAAQRHMAAKPAKAPNLAMLYTLSPLATDEAVHLLYQMLQLDPDTRVNVADALNHPYLDEGRLRYHTSMCTCCGMSAFGKYQHTRDLEPVAERVFNETWEKDLTSIPRVKEMMYRFIGDEINTNQVPLCINPLSEMFKSFANSTVAPPSELPPSPHRWK